MKEVVVTAKSNKLWKKNLAIFNRVFLGESKNGQACKILNEYVLSFDVNGGALQAKASQPLEIENSSLGYRIQYFLWYDLIAAMGGSAVDIATFFSLHNMQTL